jgi:hypothetical protein
MDNEAANDNGIDRTLVQAKKMSDDEWSEYIDTDENAVLAAWYYALAVARPAVCRLPDGEFEKLTEHEREVQLVEEGLEQVNMAGAFMESFYCDDENVMYQTDYIDETVLACSWIENRNNYIGKPLKRNTPED